MGVVIVLFGLLLHPFKLSSRVRNQFTNISKPGISKEQREALKEPEMEAILPDPPRIIGSAFKMPNCLR